VRGALGGARRPGDLARIGSRAGAPAPVRRGPRRRSCPTCCWRRARDRL